MSPPGDRPRDPLGKRALFSNPLADSGRSADSGPSAEARDDVSGLPVALSPEGTGSFTVTCERCVSVSRVGLLDMVIFSFPVAVWLPRGRFDRRMICPSCRRRAWCSVTLRQA